MIVGTTRRRTQKAHVQLACILFIYLFVLPVLHYTLDNIGVRRIGGVAAS